VPSALVSDTVSADGTQDIALDPGGVIAGNIHDQSNANLQGIEVDAFDQNHLQVGVTNTDANGNYSIPVPLGTYDVIAGGALTSGATVSAGSTTDTLNLTRFQITGRLTDVSQAAVAGKVTWGGGSATATALGEYTIQVVQGVNWFLFTPPSTSPSLGFAYETNVLINADTVKSIQ
jgi:hypothetical protein